MNKLFFSSALLLALLSGCGTSDGACCESTISKSKSISPNGTTVKNGEPNPNGTIVKDGEPITKKPIVEEKTAPVAVITPNVQTLVPSEAVAFSCSDSYDTDENGETIIACEWTFECHQKNGETCRCSKTGNVDIDTVITPHPDSAYLIATLTVTDDEGETNTTSMRYEITQ